MTSITERIKELKPYFVKVIQEYQKLETEMVDAIEYSGINSKYFAKKIKIPLSDFYYKRRTKSFTSNEMIHIINVLIGGDDDEDEDDEEELIDEDENVENE